MRNSKRNYTKIKRVIFLRTTLFAITATIIVVFLRNISRGNFADNIVSLIQNINGGGYFEALSIYQRMVRNNLDFIVFVGIVIMFLVLIWFSLGWYTRYFDEVLKGIDSLIEDENQEIGLSTELKFAEDKINSLKRALNERQRDRKLAEQRKNDLVMYLAHDIKTPLTSIIGYLSLLDEAPDMPIEQKCKYVGITLDKAYKLEKMINEFFEITRFNFSSVTIENDEIDLRYMLQQMADEFFPLLEKSNMKIDIDSNEDIIIAGDAEKLARVFNNILKNAASYGDSGSTIRIMAKKKDDSVTIKFRNRGKQIPKDKLDSLFDKFYRLDSARGSQTGGAGLGLAIAKQIVTLHNGTISAECESGYITFTVKLPA